MSRQMVSINEVFYKENKILNNFYKLLGKKNKINSTAYIWFENENVKYFGQPLLIELVLFVENEKTYKLSWMIKNQKKQRRLLEVGQVSFEYEFNNDNIKDTSKKILEKVKERFLQFYCCELRMTGCFSMKARIKEGLELSKIKPTKFKTDYCLTDCEIWKDYKRTIQKPFNKKKI